MSIPITVVDTVVDPVVDTAAKNITITMDCSARKSRKSLSNVMNVI
jgi:hypothetical protein